MSSPSSPSSSSSSSPPTATVMSADSPETFTEASRRLKDGRLVAFPTETVYGLGAHALDAHAVRRIFKAKERPLSDPVIVHVTDAAHAFRLYAHVNNNIDNNNIDNNNNNSNNNNIAAVIRTLARAFWPGPLTIVSQAADHVPQVVCAGSGYVGVRVPVHPTARTLLQQAGVPVAAPSANRFGHISPTSAAHVLSDLRDKDVLIVDGGDTCDVGIESTVVKVEEIETTTRRFDNDNDNDNDNDIDNNKFVSVRVLRRGGVPVHALRSTIARSCDANVRLILNNNNNNNKKKNNNHTSSSSQRHSSSILSHNNGDDSQPQVAPGQSLRHYAPDCPAFLTRIERDTNINNNNTVDNNNNTSMMTSTTTTTSISIPDAAVIDFHGSLAVLRDKCRWYADLSVQGDVDTAARRLFATLREAEAQQHVQSVLLPDLEHLAAAADEEKDGGTLTNVDALYDRMFRSASGKHAVVDADNTVAMAGDQS